MFSVTRLGPAGSAGSGVYALRDLLPGDEIFVETQESRE